MAWKACKGLKLLLGLSTVENLLQLQYSVGGDLALFYLLSLLLRSLRRGAVCTLFSQGWSKLKQVLPNEVPARSRAVKLLLSSRILAGCICRGGRQLGHASAVFPTPNRAAKMRKGFSPKPKAISGCCSSSSGFPAPSCLGGRE